VVEPCVGTDTVLVQSAEADPDQTCAGKVGQDLGKFLGHVRLGFAAGDEQHERQAGQHRAESAHQAQGVPVRPVKVVEHEQGRAGTA
jgi:hypothetical protein